MSTINIESYSVIELKAAIYDCLLQSENNQKFLQFLNEELKKKLETKVKDPK